MNRDVKKISWIGKIGLITLLIFALNGCNEEENIKEIRNIKESVKIKEDVKKTLISKKKVIPYPWLKGKWRGELFLHAEDENMVATFEYKENGVVSFTDYYVGEALLISDREDKSSIFFQAGEDMFQLNPMRDEEMIFKEFDTLSDIGVIYIQYWTHDDLRFTGWLKKL